VRTPRIASNVGRVGRLISTTPSRAVTAVTAKGGTLCRAVMFFNQLACSLASPAFVMADLCPSDYL